MPRLSIHLLGPFQVLLDGSPLQGFKTDKDRMLLAFLSVESARPIRREALAELLWPERSQGAALANLRHSLSILRKAVHDSSPDLFFLKVTRQTLQLNASPEVLTDVARFQAMYEQVFRLKLQIDYLEAAVSYYRGEFLEGVSMPGSVGFEAWVLNKRQHYHQKMVLALNHLACYHEEQMSFDRALTFANQMVALEPWDEIANRQLMRLLVYNRQNSAALTHFKTFRETLAQELGIVPGRETVQLYEQIRDGTLAIPQTMPLQIQQESYQIPGFLPLQGGETKVEEPVFVARDRELGWLEESLASALSFQGKVLFLAGEAGQGKTALLRAFSRRAQEAHPELIVVGGNANAFTGVGDPYHPFREVLRWLVGDFEVWWQAGIVSPDHALRLGQIMSYAVQALINVAPDLLDIFISCESILKLAQAAQPKSLELLDELHQFIDSKKSHRPANLYQPDLFEQYVRFLETLSLQRPLLLHLDDMQWADQGSIGLLFNMSRRLQACRVMVVVSYRPAEILLRNNEQINPLLAFIREFQKEYPENFIDLEQADNRFFINALIDQEPNLLGAAFRESLYQLTNGHALFCVELLRDMVSRGNILKDDQGRWLATPELDWEKLPARLEAALAQRTGCLQDELLDILRVASVEGDEFEAETIANVLKKNNLEVIKRLSDDLHHKLNLVQPLGFENLGDKTNSRYRFRHLLIQKYIYQNLDAIEMAQYHLLVGEQLEQLFTGREDDIAPRLAQHFQEADHVWKAVNYYYQSGVRALRVYAAKEAIQYFKDGLVLLERLPPDSKRNEQELDFQLALAAPLVASKGYATNEVLMVYERARELTLTLERSSRLCSVLFGLSLYFGVAYNLKKGHELSVQVMTIAKQVNDPIHVALANSSQGLMETAIGDFEAARYHFQQSIDFYKPDLHHYLANQYYQDFGVTSLAWMPWVVWLLGYPDQALKYSQKAIELARQLDHPLSLAFALTIAGGHFHQQRREIEPTQRIVDELYQYILEQGLLIFDWDRMILAGWINTQLGQFDEGLTLIQKGSTRFQESGMLQGRPMHFYLMAETHRKASRYHDGLQAISEAQIMVKKMDEYIYLGELKRVKGELLLAQQKGLEAEACFKEALQIAQQQSAKIWELRAMVSLARLWRVQGKGCEAHQALEKTYGWFKEGLATPDLVEAHSLLDELSTEVE
jgi:DNA-binding SARP family transcriptional activator